MVTKKIAPLLAPVRSVGKNYKPITLKKTSVKPVTRTMSGGTVKSKGQIKTSVKAPTKTLSKSIIVSKPVPKPNTKKIIRIVKPVIKRPVRKSALKRTRSSSSNSKKRKVAFAPRATYKTYRKDLDTNGCILHPSFQNLLKNCYMRHEKIAQIINRNSVHKVLKSGDNDEPLKVYDVGSYWWVDKSPVILHQKLEREPEFLKKFLFLLDYHIRKNQNIGESRPLTIKNNRFKIVFDNILRKA